MRATIEFNHRAALPSSPGSSGNPEVDKAQRKK